MFNLNKKFHYILLFSALFFLINTAKFPADDGFFYPQIAYNIVHEHFLGFNNLFTTNGFHPLWMVCSVLAEIINPFEKQFSLYILWFFQVLLISFGFLFLEKSVIKGIFNKIVTFTIVCLLFFSLGTLYLTEAHLAFFSLCLLVFQIFQKNKNPYIIGLVCSIVFLSRLDLIFVIAPILLLFFKENKWNYSIILKSICGFGVLSLPYLFSNLYFFGNLVPISGRIKSSFPHIQESLNFTILTDFLICCTFAYFIFLLIMRRIVNWHIKMYFTLGAMLHLFYNIFFQSQLGQWYYVPQYILILFLIHDLLSFIKINKYEKKLTLLITILGFIIVCSVAWLKLTTSLSIQNNAFDSRSKFEKKQQDLVKKTAFQLGEIIPKNCRILTYDFPGKLAFYSDFNVIPADGLVSNQDYFDQISRNSFTDFLKKNNIGFVLLPFYANKPNEKNHFIALDMSGYKSESKYYFKNTLNKRILDSTSINNMQKVANFENPIKTWQPSYDSIRLYKP